MNLSEAERKLLLCLAARAGVSPVATVAAILGWSADEVIRIGMALQLHRYIRIALGQGAQQLLIQIGPDGRTAIES